MPTLSEIAYAVRENNPTIPGDPSRYDQRVQMCAFCGRLPDTSIASEEFLPTFRRHVHEKHVAGMSDAEFDDLIKGVSVCVGPGSPNNKAKDEDVLYAMYVYLMKDGRPWM